MVIVGLFPVAFIVAFILAIWSPALTTLTEMAMIGIMAAFAIALLLGLDHIRYKNAIRRARRYLQAQPSLDFQGFRNAYPAYEEEFLRNFREVFASQFRASEEKVVPGIDLTDVSPLAALTPFLYCALWDCFCPASLKEAKIVFPIRKVETLSDLIQETNYLRLRVG